MCKQFRNQIKSFIIKDQDIPEILTFLPLLFTSFLSFTNKGLKRLAISFTKVKIIVIDFLINFSKDKVLLYEFFSVVLQL